MKNSEYKDMVWKYWHGGLSPEDRTYLWSQIQKEYLRRIGTFRIKVMIGAATAVAIIILYFLKWA